ncbi:hypothetical protein SPF06_21305 [Sinomonas sp. JGH33]|uniref:Haloacid dehalogenase n=1 Tax=Sinomonas terricola TaxID=3110330 RepID=A0ABU5TC40_9MICC|nr:hypothetical protein [Sinomonas sp. JGH33]MEA5457262.1 hypothetical protein [Sinomonas sp. JGH33]
MIPCHIVDVDGTLADVSPFLHHPSVVAMWRALGIPTVHIPGWVEEETA